MSLRTLIKQTLGLKASAKPKAKNTYPTTPSTGTYYEGMNQDYRWFRQDELTRKCITTNAYFATANGFETILESGNPDEYASVKDKVDEINKLVNLDKNLHDAQIKRSIHGRAAYEIVRDSRSLPERLLPLQSTQIKPELDEGWRLTGFTYRGKKGFYGPEEVLYLTNLDLEADQLALSDLYKMNAVRIRVIGKSHAVTVNTESYAAGLVDKMFKMEGETLRELVKLVAKKLGDPSITSALIFGSVARGEEEPLSDIDLFILTEDKEKAEGAVSELQREVSKRFGNAISPYILSEEDLADEDKIQILEEIRNKHIVVHGKPPG